MFANSIFSQNEFDKFKLAVKQYCAEQKYNNLILSDDEIAQLSWYMDSVVVTPEAKDKDIIAKFHFEIKRALARCYSFELLLNDTESAYLEFTQAQENKLSQDNFVLLKNEVKKLDEDARVAIRASCFLTIISNKTKEVLKEREIVLSNDSEEFLSQVAHVLIKDPTLFPLTKNLTKAQLALLPKLFWPNTHLRHMLYTEGADNMTQSLCQGLAQNLFHHEDFQLWKWRWLTNLFGFQGGPAAKYFDAPIFSLVQIVLNELEKIIKNPTHQFLNQYLSLRADIAGFTHAKTELTLLDQEFLAHIAAYYHRVLILKPEDGEPICQAYIEYTKNLTGQKSLASLYHAYRKDNVSTTHTYLPAITNNAYVLLMKKLNNHFEALKLSSLFTFELLYHVYSASHQEKISCLELSQDKVLSEVINAWCDNPNSIKLSIENSEVKAIILPKLTLVM